MYVYIPCRTRTVGDGCAKMPTTFTFHFYLSLFITLTPRQNPPYYLGSVHSMTPSLIFKAWLEKRDIIEYIISTDEFFLRAP